MAMNFGNNQTHSDAAMKSHCPSRNTTLKTNVSVPRINAPYLRCRQTPKLSLLVPPTIVPQISFRKEMISHDLQDVGKDQETPTVWFTIFQLRNRIIMR